MDTTIMNFLGIDPESDSVNTCLEKFQAANPGCTLAIMPQYPSGKFIGLFFALL